MNISFVQHSMGVTRAISKTALPQRLLVGHRYNSENVAERPPSFADEDIAVEDEVKKQPSIFDKSGLRPHHKNLIHGKMPYTEFIGIHHKTEKYQRKLFGKYGLQSNVDPRICFPTKKDIELKEEYERIAYPHTLQEMMQKVKLENEAKHQEIMKREEDIAKKMEKLDQWKRELKAKIAKKEADATAAKEKKERLLEEVRRHFGFKIDPRDERFKELLEQKEKEDKKKQKEAKRKIKEERMMAKLIQTTSEKDKTTEKTPE